MAQQNEMLNADAQSIKDRQAQALEGWNYSIQRMDLLIISISGAGVYVILETLKFSKNNFLENLIILKWAGLLFIATILINFASQWTGLQANKFELYFCDGELLEAKNIKKQARYERLTKRYTSWTTWLNSASGIYMFVALVIMTAYFISTF